MHVLQAGALSRKVAHCSLHGWVALDAATQPIDFDEGLWFLWQVSVVGEEFRGPTTSGQHKKQARQPVSSPSPFATPFSTEAHRSFDYSSAEECTSPKVLDVFSGCIQGSGRMKHCIPELSRLVLRACGCVRPSHATLLGRCTGPLTCFVLLAQAARDMEVQVVENGEETEGHAGVSYNAMQSALYWPSASTSQPGPEDRCVAVQQSRLVHTCNISSLSVI